MHGGIGIGIALAGLIVAVVTLILQVLSYRREKGTVTVREQVADQVVRPLRKD